MKALIALNTVLRYSDAGSPKNDTEKNELASAYNLLRSHRRRLINDILGSNAYEKYESWSASIRGDPTFLSKLSDKDRELFETVKSWSKQ